MNGFKPLILSFSLLAFTGAYAADDAKKERTDTQAKPAMSQSQAQSDTKAGASAGASTGAAAQSKDSTSAAAGASSSTSAGMAGGMSAKELRGTDIVDAQGKKLGDIEEVVLDMDSGRVHAVVLGFGGFLGLGEKHFAFPVSDLQPAKDKDKLQLNVDKEKLKDREGFAKGKYPAMSDEYWARVGGDKASAGAGQPGQKMNLVRASQVIGKDVQDQSGKDVGEVEDIMLSSDRTRIQNVVLDVEGAGQAMVEPKSLRMGKEGDKLAIDMSAEQLKSQAKPAERERRARTERVRPGGASGDAATGTTRTVPIQRDEKPAQSQSK